MKELRRTRGAGAPGASPASASNGDAHRLVPARESSGAVLPGAAPTRRKVRAPDLTERQLAGQVCDFFRRALPANVWWTTIPGGDRQATRAAGYRRGAPDLLLCHRGRCIFIELKTRTGKVEDHQAAEHLAITLAGGLVTVCRDLRDVIGFLEVSGVIPANRWAA